MLNCQPLTSTGVSNIIGFKRYQILFFVKKNFFVKSVQNMKIMLSVIMFLAQLKMLWKYLSLVQMLPQNLVYLFL